MKIKVIDKLIKPWSQSSSRKTTILKMFSKQSPPTDLTIQDFFYGTQVWIAYVPASDPNLGLNPTKDPRKFTIQTHGYAQLYVFALHSSHWIEWEDLFVILPKESKIISIEVRNPQEDDSIGKSPCFCMKGEITVVKIPSFFSIRNQNFFNFHADSFLLNDPEDYEWLREQVAIHDAVLFASMYCNSDFFIEEMKKYGFRFTYTDVLRFVKILEWSFFNRVFSAQLEFKWAQDKENPDVEKLNEMEIKCQQNKSLFKYIFSRDFIDREKVTKDFYIDNSDIPNVSEPVRNRVLEYCIDTHDEDLVRECLTITAATGLTISAHNMNAISKLGSERLVVEAMKLSGKNLFQILSELNRK